MNIKKCTSLFLVILFLVSNVGLAFNVHYCGKEIASISINKIISQQSEKGCCEKIFAKKDSCCKDKVVNFQKKSENATAKAFSFVPHFSFVIQEPKTVVFSSNKNFKSTQVTSYFCDANAPPLFKLYNQYIFYA